MSKRLIVKVFYVGKSLSNNENINFHYKMKQRGSVQIDFQILEFKRIFPKNHYFLAEKIERNLIKKFMQGSSYLLINPPVNGGINYNIKELKSFFNEVTDGETILLNECDSLDNVFDSMADKSVNL